MSKLRLTIALVLLSAGVAMALPFWLFASSGTAINKAATPIFSPSSFASPCHGAITVTITSSTPGALITLSGSPICTGGLPSPRNINVPAHADTSFTAYAYTSCSDISDEGTADYSFSCG